MYLYFEDWSHELHSLDEKGAPHGNRIIKVFAAEENPAIALHRPDIKIIECDDSPLKEDEIFYYKDRGEYKGVDLERYLEELGLTELGKKTARALFRFSNQEGFCQTAMEAKNGESWLIDNPFGVIDVLTKKGRRPQDYHLDIFYPPSLKKLKEIVDYEDQTELIPFMVAHRWRMKLGGFNWELLREGVRARLSSREF